MSITFSNFNSSNIKKIGYQNDAKVLLVTFVSGSVYMYKDVPAEVFEDFVRAQSKGKFFHANIRGKYTTTKII